MEFEGVGTVAMSGVLLQVTRKINDGDGLKRTFLQKDIKFSKK